MKEENVKAFQKAVKWGAIAIAVLLTVSIIGGIISVISAVFGIGSGVDDNMRDYEISGSITDLEMVISAAEVRIVSGDGFSVRSNLNDLSVDVSGGELKIEEKHKIFKNYNNALLEITVPYGFIFGTAEISAGAGAVNIERLASENLELSLGAGKVIIGELVATASANIEGGAGELNIKGGELRNLDFDMGVGKCVLSSRMTGECDLNMGIGEADITLIGSDSDYRISFSTGLGEVRYNGERMGKGTVGNGSCRVDIDGGIGAVNVRTRAR